MSVALEQHAHCWLIRLEGQVTLASAAELKLLLLQWLTEGINSGKNLEMDLAHTGEIDITIMQLMCAAAREAARSGARISGRASEAITVAMHDAGFDQMCGFPFQGESWAK